MSTTKRVVSMIMAILMVLGTMSCLATVASATYTYSINSDTDWAPSAPSTDTSIKSYATLDATYGTSPYFYVGVEFREQDEKGNWVATDHYVNPGQALQVYFYYKSNYYLGTLTMCYLYDKTIFDFNSKTTTPTYDSTKDTNNYGIYNTGLSSATDLTAYCNTSCSWFIENESGTPAYKLSSTVDEAYKQTYFKGVCTYSTSTKAYYDSSFSQDLMKKLFYIKLGLSIDGTSYSYCLEPGHNDEYMYYIPIKIRANGEKLFAGASNETTIGSAGYEYLADGKIGVFGLDYRVSALKNSKFQSVNTIKLSATQQANSATVYYQTISGINYDTNDANHAFQIGEPSAQKTVTFANTGDSTIEAVKADANATITLPTPTKSGYTFTGWSDGTNTYEAGASYTVTADVTLTGTWEEAASYTIKFFDGDTEYTDLATSGSAITLPAAQTKSGAKFGGWNDGTNTYAAGASYTATGDTNFTAVWKYTATFVDEAGLQTFTAADFAVGETITFPAVNDRAGYGYAWDPEYTTMPAANTTFTLKWTEGQVNYKIIERVANSDGTSYVDTTKATLQATTGSTVTVDDTYKTKTGYELIADNSVLSATVAADGSTELIVYFAPKTFDAIFKIDGEDEAYKTVPTVFGETIVKPALPDETGYTFSPWTPTDDVMNTEGKTFTTTKTPVQTTVYFQNADGSSLGQATGAFDTAITFPTATYGAKTFVGWKISGTDDSTAFSAAKYPATVTTYVAVFADKVVPINYYINGEPYQTVNSTAGAVISTISYTPAAGMTWTGWKGNATLDADVPAKVADDATEVNIYAGTSYIDYTITYLNADNSVFEKYEKQHYGDTFPVPEGTPEKTGYAFTAWDTTKTTVDGNATVKPTFAKEQYKFEIAYGLDGTSKGTVTVTYGDTLKAADITAAGVNYAVEGYTAELVYAADDSAFKLPCLIEDLGDNNAVINLKVNYAANEHTIKYYEGAKVLNTVKVAYGATIDEYKPTAEGYTYDDNWYSDAECTSVYKMPAQMIDSDIVVYTKKTANTYHDIWYDMNGTTILYEDNVAYGATIPNKEIPTREGYTDLAWSPVPGTQQAKDMTFTLVAKAGQVDYKIIERVENLDGATYVDTEKATLQATTGTTATVDDMYKTKTGYELNTDKSVLSATVAADGSTTLIVYFAPKTYTITWNDDNGANAVDYKFGATVSILTPAAKEGYSVSEWNYQNADLLKACSAPSTMPAYNINATVTYTAKSYNVITVVDDKETGKIATTFGAEIKTVAEPTKEGYTFSGWCSDEDCKNAYVFGGNMPAENVTIYGKFTVNNYTITYKVDGQTYDVDEYAFGAAITKPEDPTKTGYTFKGWDIVIPDTMPAGDLVANANFTVNSYTVTYKNGDTVVKTNKVVYDTAPTEPTTAPVKLGYEFTGWTYEPALVEGKIGAADVTATAQFAVKSWNATFYANAGDAAPYSEQLVEFGTEIAIPEEPTKTNYTFKGWKKLGADDSTATKTGLVMDAEGVTFVGVWEKDNNASFIASVNLKTTPYYTRGLATYEVVVKEAADAICIYNGSSNMYYSKATWETNDGATTKEDPASCVYNIVSGENNTEIWTVQAVFSEGTYNAYAVLENGDTDSENPFEFAVKYDVKNEEAVEDDIISLDLNKPENGQIVRGTDLIWTVKTSTDVTWLKFVGTYTLADSTEKTLTTLYKYDSTSDRIVITDDGNVRTWELTMKFTYSADDATITENWKMFYKTTNSTTWFDSLKADTLTIGLDEDVFKTPVAGYENYELISATPSVTAIGLNKKGTVTIVTTADCEKVRIKVGTKSATYQTTSANVKYADADGLRTWTITYKFSVKGNNTYTVQARGSEWGEAETFMVNVG